VTRAWTSRGTITLPSPYTWTDLGSGDLVFDGNGTMYFIGGGQTVSYLFTVTQTELLDGSPAANFVGTMGTRQYNGIAFTESGDLWATAWTSGTNYLSRVDITTGVASGEVTVPGAEPADLASCALPKPALQVSKG